MGLREKPSSARQGQEAQSVESRWGASPVPPFLESSQLLTLITAYSEGLPLLQFLMKTNMGRISLPAQCCQDLLPQVPSQAAATLPSWGFLHLPLTAQIFLHSESCSR